MELSWCSLLSHCVSFTNQRFHDNKPTKQNGINESRANACQVLQTQDDADTLDIILRRIDRGGLRGGLQGVITYGLEHGWTKADG